MTLEDKKESKKRKENIEIKKLDGKSNISYSMSLI